ncbi:hypothetical protein [Actimicrobium antarcticum]|uniref:ATP-grasp domain-containing protein n=1 Tax=Actimicrobium antarcticum TaxID=1051899 RepID=A0ABP7TID4_9BURK
MPPESNPAIRADDAQAYHHAPDAASSSDATRCSTLERMPKWLICIPLAVQWIWLTLRYRSATLPSAANPAITSGGLVGEGKLEYFNHMGPVARAATADFCAVSTATLPDSVALLATLQVAGLSFPIIAKPDLGLCGYGVQRLDNLAQLLAYLAAFPPHETVVLQRYLSQEGEAGIFYARDPESGDARIIGLALRYFPRVIGDGLHTIGELIAVDPRARRLTRSSQHAGQFSINEIPAAGAVVRLATIGSTRVGGLYRNGASCITPSLSAAIDAIARDMPEFYCGRFDVRFDHLHELCAGRGFSIIEINGAGSEAIQAWDPDIGVIDGFRMIFAKQRVLFAIGDAMRRRGVKPIGLVALRALYRRQQHLISHYPPSN